MDKDINFLPSYIDNTDFRFINVDGKYVGCLAITNYPRAPGFLEVLESIPENIPYSITYHIKKQDTNKILKELTYSISSNITEMKSNNKNQIDIDVIDNVAKDARNIRKDIQIDNEEIFYMSFILCIYTNTKEELFNYLKDFQSKLYSKNIISNILNFRQLDSYISTLPLNYIDKNLFTTIYKNFTTSALSNLFPFYTKNYIDKYGVLFGYTHNHNRICYIDMFSNKYLNSNMCIFGSSGSGKSFFTKLLIIRNYFINNNQYIIDPENEYSILVYNLSGEIIDLKKSDKCFNIFEITKNDITENNNFLELKIDRIVYLILNLIKENNNYIYKDILKENIKKVYNDKGITDDIKSILVNRKGNNIYLESRIIDKNKFPIMEDLYKEIKKESLKEKIKNEIINKFPAICNYTNIDIHNKIISLNLNCLNVNDSISILKYFYYLIENIKSFDNNTIIYFDEVWKYINNSSFNISEEMFSLYKTIRKKNAGIVTITQDISDFFNYNNGNYGKSILNNSLFKIFFKMEYSDSKKLENINLYTKDIFLKLSTLDKGNMFLGFNSNTCFLKVNANELEEKLLKEEYK